MMYQNFWEKGHEYHPDQGRFVGTCAIEISLLLGERLVQRVNIVFAQISCDEVLIQVCVSLLDEKRF